LLERGPGGPAAFAQVEPGRKTAVNRRAMASVY